MSISIFTNVVALQTNRQLNVHTKAVAISSERLSSGLRINRASDDAAGLAIADKLRADALVASVAIRNASDAVSMVAIADDALQEIGSILARMAELAEQSANGIYTTV